MYLAEMLCYADIRELSRIAQHYQCECNGHSKNELIQSILTRLNQRTLLQETVEQLPEADIRFLNALLFNGKNEFSMEELAARARLSSQSHRPDQLGGSPRTANREVFGIDTDPDDLIARFRQNGWLFRGATNKMKYLLQMPEDLQRRFRESLARVYEKSVTETGEPEVYRDEQGLFAADMRHFLTLIYQSDMPVTQDGYLYKKELLKVLEGMSVTEALPGGGWRFGYGRKFKEYPNRFSLMVDYCYYKRWIEEEEGMVRLSDAGQSCLEQHDKINIAEVYRFWIKCYKGPIRNIATLLYWIRTLASKWVQTESLSRTICPLIRPFYYDSPSAILHERLLLMLLHLGLLRMGEHGVHGKVVRMNPAGIQIMQGLPAEEVPAMEWT